MNKPRVQTQEHPSQAKVATATESAAASVESSPKAPAKRDLESPIVVTIGDISCDWLWFHLSAEDAEKRRKERGPRIRNWQYRAQIEPVALHGGAWYVDNFIRILLGPQDAERAHTYFRLDPAKLRACDCRDIIHSETEFQLYPTDARRDSEETRKQIPEPESERVYRVHSEPRFFGPPGNDDTLCHPRMQGCPGKQVAAHRDTFRNHEPAEGESYIHWVLQQPHPFPEDVRQQIVVIHDEGNGFCNDPDNWVGILPGKTTAGLDPKVKGIVLTLNGVGNLSPEDREISDKTPRNPLWAYLATEGYLERTVVIIGAEDLRRAGVQISKSVSWERSAHDFLSRLRHPVLRELTRAGNVVVRFGISGILHYIKSEQSCYLYYDPEGVEGEYRREHEGRMFGYNASLAATVVEHLFKELKDSRPGLADGAPKGSRLQEAFGQKTLQSAVEAGLKPGLANCRALFRHGLGAISYPLRSELEKWDRLQDLTADEIQKNMSLKVTKLGITQEQVATPGRDLEKDFPLIVRFHVLTKTALTARPLLYPGRVAVELGEKMKRALEQADGSSDQHGGPRLQVDVSFQEVDHRRGQAILNVELCWQAPADDDPHWDALCARLEELVGPTEIDEVRKDHTNQEGKEWARTLANTWVHQIWKREAVLIHWQHGWPACITGFSSDASSFAKVRVENDPNWAILSSSVQHLEYIAMDIVQGGLREAMHGKPKKGANAGDQDAQGCDGRFPCARFGKMTTVDRKEIESFRSIRNLMREYLAKARSTKPLSIAVFGPPGSGKSFGVQEIAKSVAGGNKETVDYQHNLSQFASPRDLTNALIRDRDKALGGVVPLLFFDEFDAALDGEPLGWLKYFLSVMQDGKFRHEGEELSIGSAILVFAGGISESYKKFTRKGLSTAEQDEFRVAKGPDFVSRLRGFVDIIGPDRRPKPNDEDKVFIIRRAIILRSMLETQFKHLTRHKDGPVDRDVARALLNVSGYEHGTRSLEAILVMSALAKADRFDKSALPPKDQLAMHLAENPTKPNEFFDLLDEWK